MARRKPTEPRRHPRQARARVTVESIVTAAERVVAREGTQRATTNRIAAVAGVSIGSLYQYFPNKDVLIETIRTREEEAFDALLLARFDALAALPLRDAVHGFVDLLISHHRETLVLHNALAADNDLFHVGLERRWLPILVQYLTARGDIRPANVDLAARIALGVVEALTHDAALRAPELLDDHEYSDELTELLFRYLTK